MYDASKTCILPPGAGRESDMQEASSRSQTAAAEMHTSAGTPTLTFPTPPLKPQQHTPTLAGPAVLQPELPLLPASHTGAATGSSASTTGAPLPGALPSSPVHGVWNRASQAPSPSQDRPAAAAYSSRADRGTGTNLADVAAELLPETPQLAGSLAGQQASHAGQMQEETFDHRSLLAPAEPQSAALLAVSFTPLFAWYIAYELQPHCTTSVCVKGFGELHCEAQRSKPWQVAAAACLRQCLSPTVRLALLPLIAAQVSSALCNAQTCFRESALCYN